MSARASSLRLKLTLWYLLVFAAIQLLLLAAVVVLRHESTAQGYDREQARLAGVMVDNVLVAGLEELTDDNVRDLVPSDAGFVFFVIRDAQGAPVAASPRIDPARVPFRESERVSVGPTGPVYTSFDPDPELGLAPDLQQRGLRMVTLPFHLSQGQRYYLQAAVPARDWTQLLAPFGDLFALGVPIGLVAACAAAWLIGGRAVAPFRRISEAAQDVRADRLETRIDVDARDPEVAHLQRELNEALARIETGYRSHERFLSAVSHELNTPVAVLLAEAQTLKGAVDGAEGERFVLSVEEEMRRLQTLTRSLLSLSRAQFVQDREEVPLADVLRHCVERCRPLAAAAGVTLTLAPVPETHLSGDRWLLETMLDNLLRNAIRHSPQDETVEISSRVVLHDIQISVQDRGPGIPQGWRDRVFEAFAQVPGQPQSGGTGLGLSIAQRVAQVHGGSIALQPRDGGGSRFTVRLPLKDPRVVPRENK
jgi:signal transduction histidine kinase